MGWSSPSSSKLRMLWAVMPLRLSRCYFLHSVAAIVAVSLTAACAPKTPAAASFSPDTAAASQASPTTPVTLEAEGPMVQNPQTSALSGLRRGINLGNGLDAPSEGEWGVVLSERHFSMAKAGGFDHIRLPVRFSAHAESAPPYRIDPEFFSRVDWALDQAEKNGLAVLLDVHHYEELMEDPDAHVDRLVGFWEQIAPRYAARPASLLFEPINEPSEEFVPEKLNPTHARIVEVIRRTNPTRTIVLNGFFWANPSHIQSLKLPDDTNVVATFHMYEPFLFTHQGADWVDPWAGTTGVIFPGPPASPLEPVPAARETGWVVSWINSYNRDPLRTNPSGPVSVEKAFGQIDDFVKKTGRPVMMGEFGAINKADEASRERWYRLVRQQAERRGIPWTVWDDGGRFQLMNVQTGEWNVPLARALGVAQ